MQLLGVQDASKCVRAHLCKVVIYGVTYTSLNSTVLMTCKRMALEIHAVPHTQHHHYWKILHVAGCTILHPLQH